jgi:WD40 repeat protein
MINNLKIIEFEYYKDYKIAFSYLLYKNESYLSLLTFSQINEKEEEIHYFSVYKNKYLILVLNRGKVILISLENYKILSIYKSNFGLITSISFSNDGNLLGLGAQDNNAYIIDLNNRNIISCLEGHSNYISKMIFELQEDNNNKYLYSKDEQINVNLVRNKKNIFQKTNKEFILEKWGNSLKEQLNDKRMNYRKMSTVKITNHNSFKIYDIFTCGLDGKIGSYRIEYYENNCLENKSEIKSMAQENNTDNISSSKIMTNKNINNNNNNNPNTKKLYYLNKLIMLNPPENDEYDKTHFIFMNNIINEPIIDFFKNDLLFVIASKVNILGSEIKLIFFECEESDSSLKSRIRMNKTSNASIASDLEELNNLSVKIKIPK